MIRKDIRFNQWLHYSMTVCERFKRFFHLMLEEGVYLAPSAFEAGFMSVAHSEADINNTIDAARRVFAKL